jgi:hypothetical protein
MAPMGHLQTPSWFVIGELHNDDGAAGGAGTSPPFAIQLHRDHLQVVARYCPTGLNPSNRPQSYESDALDQPKFNSDRPI